MGGLETQQFHTSGYKTLHRGSEDNPWVDQVGIWRVLLHNTIGKSLLGFIKLTEQVLLCWLRRLHPLSQNPLRCLSVPGVQGELEQALSLLLWFLSAQGIGNAASPPEQARNGDHPKCVIYEFSYLLKCCRTSPCVPSAFTPRIQRILKHSSDSVWSRWFWSFYFKIISVSQ